MTGLRANELIIGRTTKIPGFCGGASCYSEEIHFYRDKLDKESAIALVAKYLTANENLPVMFFPDRHGGRWDTILKLIGDSWVVFDKGQCTYYYRLEGAPVGNVTSWTSTNDVKTYVMIGEAVPTEAAWKRFKDWYVLSKQVRPYGFDVWQRPFTGLVLEELVAREKERGRELYDYS